MAQGKLKIPDIRNLNPDDVLVRYDEPSDTLFVHFYGSGVPGVSLQIDDHVFVRLDETEERIIGIQIEAYFQRATIERPELLLLAQFAGVSSDTLRKWSARSETRRARLSAIDVALQDWSHEHPFDE